jgi:hypothetical protein
MSQKAVNFGPSPHLSPAMVIVAVNLRLTKQAPDPGSTCASILSLCFSDLARRNSHVSARSELFLGEVAFNAVSVTANATPCRLANALRTENYHH